MLSRVAAVKAPRTHNRRGVTGSSGKRREGGESEPPRPNMSRRVFTSAVLLLLFVMMCRGSGASNVVATNSGNLQLPHTVDLFVPQTTQVVPKEETGSSRRDSFVSPSLVSAGGVIAAFAEGRVYAEYVVEGGKIIEPISSDVVAEYIDYSWDWSTIARKVSESTWKAYTVLGPTDGTDNRVEVFYHPTTTTKGNKVFLLAGSLAGLNESGGRRKWDNLGLKLVVGDVREPTISEPTGSIKWDQIRSLLNESNLAAHKGKLTELFAAGGSGILMEDGMLVFPLMAKSGNGNIYSMIIYSNDNGSTWSLSTGFSPAKCETPRVTEWEGSLLMIVDCVNGQRVYESRDMGTTWTEAIGKLPGVWVKSQSFLWDMSLHVDALITATIGGRKVMLYIQRGNFSEKNKPNPLYLWVTDNNRSFYFGPVAMRDGMNWLLASTLLHSDGKLHLLQRRGSIERSVISLSRLTEELKEIESALSTWAQKDVFFSKLSIPTAGLVAVLSGASSDDTWSDEYLCLNATVTNAKKVKDGLKFTEPDSGVIWPVNIPDDNVRHISLSHNFTLVASVTIEGTPSEDAHLLGAIFGDTNSSHTMGVLYTANNKWETIFKGETKPTTKSDNWESGKEYQVALMLQSNKSSIYIDGKSLGEEEVPLTGEKPLELVSFCFGACGMKNFPVTVTNVFLYNRPLNPTEMTAIKDRKPVPKRAPEPQAGGVSQIIASAVSGPEKNSAAQAVPVTSDPHAFEEVSEGEAAKRNTSRTEDVQFVVPEVSLNSAGSGLLPLLLLLGLWGFAAA
ncbi:trans-sialidase [Trypanosoma cruzi Dm28c]|uniref:Trans-sialidase n=2 Tax=Trypanosoma cruzi TaxID=5693 RepID=V5BAU1_TRYCR|nr:trans-sialidase [Trypanosoma cruzi Dm28c]PBJ77017.1 trans-sialidase [Trypanosoma cruzi cruzi]PWU88946.1 putative trans-sialidase, Group II [Trypanosoma cruzi]